MNRENPQKAQTGQVKGGRQTAASQAAGQQAHPIKASVDKDGHTLMVALADFVAQPELYAHAFADMSARPVRVRFI